MSTKLSHAHRHTYDAVFQHPVAHNLNWRDIKSMLNALAKVAEQENGNLKVTRNGETLVLHPTREKQVAEIEQLMEIRHFLQRSETVSQTGASAATDGSHFLIVIDHREARVYKASLHGAVAKQIESHDPHGFGRHLHFVQDEANGQRKPERPEFYEAVVKTLQGAEQILLFGRGKGASSAMEHLLSELNKHHPDLAKRIVGSIVVDEQHLTKNQLLAKARKFYETTLAN